MEQKKTGSQLAEFEKDKSFKRSYLPFSCKWKSWLYIAPVLILFMSLFAVLYLLQNNKLVSWYVLPYLVLFVIATIWFKAVRKHLIDTFINKPESFITAFAKPVLTDNYKVYALFSIGASRHNPKVIEHQASTASSSYADLIPQLKPGQAILLQTDNNDLPEPLYVACLRKFSVRKNNIGWDEKSVFPILLIDKKKIKTIP